MTVSRRKVWAKCGHAFTTKVIMVCDTGFWLEGSDVIDVKYPVVQCLSRREGRRASSDGLGLPAWNGSVGVTHPVDDHGRRRSPFQSGCWDPRFRQLQSRLHGVCPRTSLSMRER